MAAATCLKTADTVALCVMSVVNNLPPAAPSQVHAGQDDIKVAMLLKNTGASRLDLATLVVEVRTSGLAAMGSGTACPSVAFSVYLDANTTRCVPFHVTMQGNAAGTVYGTVAGVLTDGATTFAVRDPLFIWNVQ